MLNADFSQIPDEMEPRQPLFNRLRYSRTRVSLGTLFGILTLALYVGYKAGFLKARQDGMIMSDNELAKFTNQLQKENAQLHEKIMSLEHDYQIQLIAKKDFESHLKSLQKRNAELTQEMSLYQTLVGSTPTAGVQIKTFRAFSTKDPHTFRYLLILSQTAARRDIQGVISMTVLGKIDQKTIRLPVKYVDSAQTSGLSYKFRHLQELSGELTFPEQFVPEEVLLRITQKGGESFQQLFPWVSE